MSNATNRSIAILGSARSDGNTARVLARLVDGLPCDTLDLSRQRIAEFSYAQAYADGDEFLAIVERIVAAPVTILATPVYWYSYSAPMKRFVDRFTDLLFAHKPLGRKLRGRRFALLSTGSDPKPDELLNAAYRGFCNYLSITNLGIAYAQEDGPFHDEEIVAAIRREIASAAR